MQDKRLKEISIQLMGVIEKMCKKNNMNVEEVLNYYTNLSEEEKKILCKSDTK